MKRRAALEAALIWLIILCGIQSVAARHGLGQGSGGLNVATLALVSALAVGLTYGVAVSPLLPATGYIVSHLAGVLVVVVALEWPAPPWAWHAVPGLAALFSRPVGSVDAATIALLSGGLAWELAYACTWLVVRERRVWLALGLIVGILALTQQPWEHDTFVALLCIAGLLLVVVVTDTERQLLRPRRLQAGLSRRLTPLLLIPISVLLVAGAWAMPLPQVRPWGSQAGPWQIDISNATIDRLISRLGLHNRQSTPAVAGLTALSSFGRELRVGGTFSPTNTPMLAGYVADPTHLPYWRGAVYDRYVAGAWHILPAATVREAGGVQLPLPDGAARTAPITQVVDLLRPSGTLFTAGVPLLVQTPAVALVSSAAPSSGVLSLAPAQGTVTGRYAAASLLPATAPLSPPPTLSAAVRDIDLSLPTLPRVVALARRLVGHEGDAYRRALALQGYLRDPRNSFIYDTSPPQAPSGRDPVDYFLFDAKRGFCTHFAAAMVVLARAAGIPARLVTGYLPGHLENGRLVATAADAHAWPELWITGRGWLPFEPTPGFAASAPGTSGIVRPTSSTNASAVAPTAGTAVATAPLTATTTASAGAGGKTSGPRSGSPHSRGGDESSPLQRVGPMLVLGAALLVLARLFTLFLYARGDATELYARMRRLAGLLRAAPRAGQTPLEWAREIAVRAPDDGAAVLAITGLYVRQRYGGRHLQQSELVAARSSWRMLRLRWLRRLLLGRRL
jgi:transglutaminase-like putative cysteine protease